MGPSLSAGTALDEFIVEASDEHGTPGRAILQDGVEYLVVIEGTFSVWEPRQWRDVCLGSPDIGPLYRSIVRTGPAGLDAAYAFAIPAGSSLCSRAFPVTNPGWVYRLRPEDPWTSGPTGVPYSPNHVYRFPFVGAGAPLTVAVRDVAGQYGDNYGRLQVTVLRTAP